MSGMTLSMSPTDTARMFSEYAAAWARHDPDEIASFHTDDSAFTVAALGVRSSGRAEVREAVAQVCRLWPDIEFQERRLYTTADFIVFESTMLGTLAQPLPVGDAVVWPNGRRVALDIVDLIEVRDGGVHRKDTYLDALGYLAAMRA